MNYELVCCCVARILLQLGVAIHCSFWNREDVGVTVGLRILAEPRLATIDIHIGTSDGEANDVVAAVCLAHKLTSQLVEQSTELNVVATLVVLYPVILFTKFSGSPL